MLIDESQDTKKELIDALLIVCEKYGEKFIVGMFGDTMQKIYNDGKDNLAKCIPDNWVKPVKIMNHRSAKRIVTLANSIRSSVDDQKQQARSDAEEGTVRLFITSKSNNKEYVEKRVAEMMVQDTGDIGWNDEEDYKSLILEHHMAASRFGFSELYMPLSNSKKFDTSLREGSIPELSILSKLVFPLLVAYQSGNDFEVAKIIRKNSPLLNKEVFITGLNNQVELLRKAEEAVELLMKLWNDGKVPTCLEVLKSIRDTGLFKVGNRVDEVLADYSQDENEKIREMFRDCYALFIISPFLSEGVIADLLDDYNSNADAGPARRCLITREASVTKRIFNAFNRRDGDGIWVVDPVFSSNDALDDGDTFGYVNRDVHAKASIG